MANLYFAKAFGLDFIGKNKFENLGINWTVKIAQGVTLHPLSLFMVKSLINCEMLYPHKTEITNTKVTKICSWSKIWVLNVNLGSNILYDTS